MFAKMSQDLTRILEDWPHQGEQIQARKIMGDDGRQKIQLRIDLGLIQMQTDGRPDGKRPNGFESYLDFFKDQAAAKGDAFQLDEEDCGLLQQEGIQYYHRYVTLFQLEDYQAVVRDTRRNLELFDFVELHCDDDDIRRSFTQFRPYVLMMLARAEGLPLVAEGKSREALAKADAARKAILQALEEDPALGPPKESNEIAFLSEWIDELKSRSPRTRLEKMNAELSEAIEEEAYERAAKIRDAIRELTEKPPSN